MGWLNGKDNQATEASVVALAPAAEPVKQALVMPEQRKW